MLLNENNKVQMSLFVQEKKKVIKVSNNYLI